MRWPVGFDKQHIYRARCVMPEPTAATRRSSRAVLMWAVAATVAALVLGNVALVLWMRLRQVKTSVRDRVLMTREISQSRPKIVVTVSQQPIMSRSAAVRRPARRP
jgi:hypothetical protein